MKLDSQDDESWDRDAGLRSGDASLKTAHGEVDPTGPVETIGTRAPSARADRSGTQCVERTIALMRELAARGQSGWRLRDLSERCGIDKGTAHRLLACMVRERLVRQRAADRHYLLGPLLWELGLSVHGPADVRAQCNESLAQLAKQFNALAFLMVRSGNEFVCAAREGTVKLQATTIDIGTRRPLFASASGVAILLALPAAESKAILAENVATEIVQRGRERLKGLRSMLRRSQKCGFGVSLGDVVPGIHAVGAPVRGPDGRPLASLALIGLSDDIPETRFAEMHKALDNEATLAGQDYLRFMSHGGS
jgi:DNA-binding IclR family transcriptional regulator